MFARFEAMYGRTFADMWAGTNIAAVKTEWAENMRFYTGLQIAWALDQCRVSSDLPPTLPRFLGLCRAAPRPEQKPLPAPKIEQEVAAARAAEVKRQAHAAIGRHHGHAWAVKVLDDIAAGIVLPNISEQFAVEALANVGMLKDAPAAYVKLNRACWRNLAQQKATA